MPARPLPGLRVHSYPESQPILGVDLLELCFDRAVDFARFLAQVPKPAERRHPGCFACLGVGNQLLPYSLGNEFSKGNSTAGRRCFRAAENSIGNFQGGLHAAMLPYLWERVNGR